jgi:predicted permease
MLASTFAGPRDSPAMLTDLRFALRMLRKNLGFSAVVVVSLALGIAANATVLCWLQHAVLRPLPGVERQEEMVVIVSNQGGGNVSLDDLADFEEMSGVFAGAVAWQMSTASLRVDEQAEWVPAQVVSAGFFDRLGVRPIHGRTFLAGEDEKPGGNPVLVISERLWRRRFSADPRVIGRVVDLNRHAFTIVGVVPASFQGTVTLLSYDVWAPLSMIWEVRNQRLEGRSARGWHNLARLGPGVTVAQARAAVARVDANLAATYPDTNRDVRHRVLPYSQCPYGAQAVLGPAFWLLLAVSLGALLIVTANVANLTLARAASRQKEIAIRRAAGAGRARLVRQQLTESLVLALAGGLAGAGLASFAVDGLSWLPADLPANVVFDYQLDARTLGLTLLLTLGAGLLFGVVPALRSSSGGRLLEALKDGRASTSSGSHRRLRSILVVSEIALAAVLLVCAGLCVKGLRRAHTVEVGFDPSRVLVASMQIGMNGHDVESGRAFYRRLQQRLAEVPGVEAAGLASWFPLGLAGCKGAGVAVEGRTPPPGEDLTYEFAIVSPRYFDVVRIPLLAGRDFTDADVAEAPAVAIVNEAFARRFWPKRDAVGQRFRSQGAWRTVVGVVPTGKYNRLDEGDWCFFYLPYQQYVPDLDLSVCLRTAGDPGAMAASLRRVVHEVDPRVDLLRTQRLARAVEGVFVVPRMASALLSALGLLSLALAAMGVYAVVAYDVSQRTREFGLRMALGAAAGKILGQVVGQGLRLAAVGLVAGLGLASAATRLLAGFLYGVSAFDLTVFAGAPALLGAVAAVACLVPARRATRVDPMVALRSE